MLLRAMIFFIGFVFTLTIIQIGGVPERIKNDDGIGITFDDRFPPILRREEGHNDDAFQNATSKFMNENTYKKLRRKRKVQNKRIIGGGTALENRYPYMASLTFERGHTCGGSLIADDIILSAAHCWESFDGVDIGRHNVKDPDEDFERYNIEKFVTHPGYIDKNSPGAAFNNDFMIIKLYGWSKKTLIQLNTEPDIPKTEEELSVMGWGVADIVNKLPSEELKEVTVNSISNNQCRNKSGYVGGKKISLMGRITNNMMCAQDKDEDACQGDSGGPLIIKGLLPRLDVQVGVVSWGMGCAHEMFPGVYSRISSQMTWIKKTVCEWSESPPDEFGCQKSERENGKDGSDAGKRPVTVDIMLDRFPKETGWLIRTKDGKSIAYIPIGGYKNVKESEKHIFATVHLKANEEYEFIMLDSYGDGLKFDGGKYKLWLGDTPYLGKLLAEGSTFGRSIHHVFKVPKKEESQEEPDSEPSPQSPGDRPTSPVNEPSPDGPVAPPTPSSIGLPTIANAPSQKIPSLETPAPTPESRYITIAIKLDNYPEEVGWAISSSKNELIASKPTGFYKRKNQLIIEKVRIPDQYLYSSDSIVFALLDNGQDGLCCDKGQGLFQVFIGDISEDNLVVKGSQFQRLQHFDIDLFHQSSSSATSSGKIVNSTPSPAKLKPLEDEPTSISAGASIGKQLMSCLLSMICSIAIILL